MLLAGASGALAAPARDPAPRIDIQLAQVTIEQRVIIRIPVMPPSGARRGRDAALTPPAPPIPPAAPKVKEVKGPKCLKLDHLRGAVISSASGVTMVTDRDERFRAHFDRTCLPASFYSGFYIEPNKDGAICAQRDVLHARNGSSCDIERFSKLIPDDDEPDE